MDVKPPPSAPQDIKEAIKESNMSTWRPFLIGNRMRTTSEDSAESFDAYDKSFDAYDVGNKKERRLSITEQFFGSSMPGRLRSNSTTEYEGHEHEPTFKKVDLKQFMKHQRKILGDDEWQ
ncbi:hypothetical protein ACQ4LE_007706 [Meloidogyne hapla]|uniref:Uncharacterized protein n=1 Tax=Meloidogyne hapla TaxID=6305 RepID=A0A1I8B380_MELHA